MYIYYLLCIIYIYWLLYVLIPCMEMYVNVCIYVCKWTTYVYVHAWSNDTLRGWVYCSGRRVIWDHYRLFHDPYEMVLGSMLGDLFRGIDRVGKGVWSQHNSVAVTKRPVLSNGHSLNFFEKHESLSWNLDIGLFRHPFCCSNIGIHLFFPGHPHVAGHPLVDDTFHDDVGDRKSNGLLRPVCRAGAPT